jgi:hypothetical protein
MTFDLYVWKSPRELEPDEADALVAGWLEAGGDPASSPFEPSGDVGWFCRELRHDLPELEISTDASPNVSSRPNWLATEEESPARVVALRLPRGGSTPDDFETILGLAAKYDLVLFDPHGRRVVLPLEVMAAYASATFWPRGAIQAGVAGAIGALLALVGWLLPIPVVGWVLILVGGFLVVMAIYTFIHEGRVALGSRRRDT